MGSLKTGRLARGPMVVVQALFRRLITPRGVLRERGNALVYGLDVSGYIGSVGYPMALLLLRSRVRTELSRDERVAAIDCKVSQSQDSAGKIYLVLDVWGELKREGGTFTFTAHANDVTTELITANAA